LAVSEPVTPVIGDFQVNINDAVRPYPVLNTSVAATTDPALRKLTAVGGIDQLTHADDALREHTAHTVHTDRQPASRHRCGTTTPTPTSAPRAVVSI
jgi:hypothetical protein